MKQSAFVNTLGKTPQIKVLDFLMDNVLSSYTLFEIKNETDTGYATLKYLLPKMLKDKLVIIDKKVSKANLYKLNTENKAIQHLMAFDWALVTQSIEEL